MKKIYWRPQRISLRLLWVVALIGIAGLIVVETYTVREKQPHYTEKIKAARLAKEAFEVIRQERLRLGHTFDPESDPAGTGLIGQLLTPVTTNPGHLPAKQTTANPNFAAVIVHLLKRADVEEGDKVAVGFSGSFPAINTCVLAALQTLKLQAIIISSVGSSQWGANIPTFMWPDMERVLAEKRLFNYRSVAISRGGIDDRALGLTKDSRRALDVVIERSGIPALTVSNYGESVEKRMSLYQEFAGEDKITAYLNVGGGTTSVGTKVGKRMFDPGLNRSVPRGAYDIDSVMTRYAMDGIPIIHMIKIDTLAERYGLPLQPTVMPKVGEGKIFYKEVHSTELAAAVLLTIIVLLTAFIRQDWGYRMLNAGKKESKESSPEPMV